MPGLGAAAPALRSAAASPPSTPDVQRAVVVLADGPELDPRAVDRLAAHTAPFAAASYDGTRDHPVALARSAFADIPDEGLRAREPVLVDCSDLRAPGDVDVRKKSAEK